MEEKEVTGNTDNPEMVLPSTNSSEAPEKKPALKQRLAETFREGIASTKPDGEKRPEVKAPPPPKKKPQEPVERKIASLNKYADAFREGAASVKSREGAERREAAPIAAKKKPAPAAVKTSAAPVDGKGMLDMVLQAAEEAMESVRKTVTKFNLDEFSPAGLKIRTCKKKINNLYIAIGSEAVNSGQGGPVETAKMTALLDELQKNEEEILSLQSQPAKAPPTRKMPQAKRPQPVKKEAAITPEADKKEEEAQVVADLSGAVPDDAPAGSPAVTADLPEPENKQDALSDIADIFVATAPEAESPASVAVPMETVSDEAAPNKEEIDGDARK